MNWLNAYVRGFLVFSYFLVATVMIPNYVLKMDAIGSASTVVQDLVVLGIWGAGLVVGMYLLRRFQANGTI
jgi:hypothetical protein